MLTLHRAPWVLPIITPAIADGAVIVDDKQVVAVGPYAALSHEVHDKVIDHEGRILMPALVNGHCHLELSAFAELAQKKVEAGNMPAWISDLLALRARSGNGEIEAQMASDTLAAQYADGVALLVDIGNGLSSSGNDYDGVDVLYFSELLGLSSKGTEFGLQTLNGHPHGHQFTCHAPYSTSSVLLQAVKERARQADQLFPIHVAESHDEVEFLHSGQGRLRTFLEQRGVWDGSFVAPGTGAVNYLDQLGLIDARTLCVHCVHLADDEIKLLVQRDAKVCLCPGSNRFLGVGRAPADKMLAHGLRPCLGTDSKASNPQLSMWREMAIVAEDHPGLPAATILAMATLYGAEALGNGRAGHLQAGSSNHFLAVCYDGHEPVEFLVGDPAPKEISWL